MYPYLIYPEGTIIYHATMLLQEDRLCLQSIESGNFLFHFSPAKRKRSWTGNEGLDRILLELPFKISEYGMKETKRQSLPASGGSITGDMLIGVFLGRRKRSRLPAI